jgi:hypothetical protein
MAKVQFLTYYICLNDPDLVAQYQNTQWIPAVTVPGTIPLGVVNRAISPGANEEFDAPFFGYTDTHTPGANYIWTPWSGIGEEDGPFPLNVATFQRKTGGFWIFGGTTVRYYWMGQFVYVPPATPSVGGVPATPEDVAEVKWADGFELPQNGEGGVSAGFSDKVSPDAARHLGGFGCAIRGNTGTGQKVHRFDENGGANPSEARTRCYIRLRRAPDVSGYFWDCRTTTSATAAIALKMTPSRTLAIYSIQATVLSFLTALTFEFALNTWYRLDVLLRCGQNPPNDGKLRLYINGTKIGDLLFTTSEGLGGGGASPRLQDVRIGHGEAVPGFEMDIDDWTGHAFPAGTDEGWTGRDWLYGTRVVTVRQDGFGPGHGAWTGDARQLQTRPVGTAAGSPVLSTSSGAVLQIETDYLRSAVAEAGSLFTLAFGFAAFHNRAAGAADSQLGYALDGATFVDAAAAGTTTEVWKQVLLSRHGAGINLPAPIAGPLRVRFVKSADATQVNVRGLFATALLCGTFGEEDRQPGDPDIALPVPIGIHNTPYPHSPWSLSGLPPLSPVAILSGTYAGDNLAEDILLKIPAHWFWVRPLTGGTGGVQWWSTMLGSHIQLNQGTLAEAMIRGRMNELFNGLPGEEQQSMQAVLSPTGSNAQANATGVTYQFIAFMDPGMRFLICGAFHHGASPALVSNPLVDPLFTPQMMFFAPEAPNSTITDEIKWKGPGNAAGAWQVLSGAEEATAITFTGAGAFQSETNAHESPSLSQVPYAAFRDDDGILDAAGLTQRGKAVQVWSYVGDGAASRTLGFAVPIGKRPLFAMIGPTNGVSYFRDPGNTTVNSQQVGAGTNSTTAITAGGLDQITVGVTLNTNAVVYNVFMIPGGTTAGNGGWGTDGEYVPVEPDTAPGDQWGPDFPGEPTTPVEPPIVLVDEPDIDTTTVILSTAINVGGLLGGQVCEVYSRKLANIALSRIGITKQIANLATEQTEAAATMRRHMKEDINTVLRDHPWSFATRYQNLVLHDGDFDDPFNNDWTFAYLAPNAMMFARRLSKVEKGRTFDPEPIPFRHYMSVAVGPLILTNVEASVEVPLVLEYTIRHDCPAFFGDAIFRDALAWRFAKSLATGLSRDSAKAEMCEAMYRDVLSRATVVVEREQQQDGPGDADWISGRN